MQRHSCFILYIHPRHLGEDPPCDARPTDRGVLRLFSSELEGWVSMLMQEDKGMKRHPYHIPADFGAARRTVVVLTNRT
mgnify:FL=1